MSNSTMPHLDRNALRRILVSLIAAEQAALCRRGTLGGDMLIGRHAAAGCHSLDTLNIGPVGLGFDSLARLDLVLRVNRFFGLHKSGVEDYLIIQDRLGDWVDLLVKHVELSKGDLSITFATSGSSGPEKHVTHQITALLQELDALMEDPAWMRPGRILSLVPAHHIYGLLHTCLLPGQIGVDVVDLQYGAPSTAISVARHNDLIVATPHIWSHLLQTGLKCQPGVRGITSGGPSSSDTWRICIASQLSALTEVYGATETGGVGIRCAEHAPFRLLGHLSCSGENIVRKATGEVLDLQDHLRWQGDNEFLLGERKDDVFQVGGVNVSPAYVARTLLGIKGVKEAAVRRADNKLKAFIVTQQDEKDPVILHDEVRHELRKALQPAAYPDQLSFGSTLPRDAMGKLTDWV